MAKQVFAFADYVFDSETATLTRKNHRLRLSEQNARALAVLLERANNLVSREELRQVLWPDEEFLDYDQGINVVVNRLRNALREDSRRPQFLKTIPKRGYTFCGEVRVVTVEVSQSPRGPGFTPALEAETTLQVPIAPAADPAEDDASTLDSDHENALAGAIENPAAQTGVIKSRTASSTNTAFKFRWLWLSALLLLLVATALVVGRWHSPVPVAHVLRLGIAPIRAKGDAQTTELAESFRLGLSDAVAKLPGVQVPAAGAFVTSNAIDIPRFSRELNLDDLLLGSLTKVGEQYDMKFELIRAADATHLASFEYSGPQNDLPTISERLQQEVFHYLQSNATTLQAIKGSTNDAQAYELYLQGNYWMLERNPDSINRSLDDFRRATDRDPNFAAAYAGMATAYLKLSAYNTDPRSGLLSKAEALAQRSVKLDPMLAQAHAVLGCTAYKQDRDFARGESELLTAIRIDPTQAAYRDWLSVLLVEEGRFDEALQQLNYAQTNAPFWPSVYAMEGLVGVYARRDAVAIGAAKKYASLLPNLPIAHNTLAWVDFETAHYKDAIEEWRQMALLQNDQARVDLEDRGLEALKKSDVKAYARLRLEAIQHKQGTGQVNDFMPAEWYACAGDRDHALTELERLTASGDPYMLHVGVDPLYDSFHKDPRFLALLAKAGITIPPALKNATSHLCQ